MSSRARQITIEEAKERLRSPNFEPPWKNIDPAIAPLVKIFWEEGHEPFESCQGGPGHTFPEPTIRFSGSIAEGPRLVSTALRWGMVPCSLRRVWAIQDKEMVGADWEMTFYLPDVPNWYAWSKGVE
jgi:hypothetical protein